MAQPVVPRQVEGVAGNSDWKAHQVDRPRISIRIGGEHEQNPSRSQSQRHNIVSGLDQWSSPIRLENHLHSVRSFYVAEQVLFTSKIVESVPGAAASALDFPRSLS